tara:strand:- start:2967 stop:3452 length:486 start_codon:yes stop_codon:yes gene_type:complete
MISKINLFFLTFFFIGKIKYAPGTLASFFACLLFLFLEKNFSYSFIFIITLIIFIFSFISINYSADYFKTDDPQEIVIDEVLGQILVLLAIPIYETLYPLPIIYYCAGSFFLFRLFDIWKPYPINYVDNNISGSLGIMLDDIVASIYSILILSIIFFFIGA